MNTYKTDSRFGYIVIDPQYNIIYMNDYFKKKLTTDSSNFFAKKCFYFCNGGTPCSECVAEKSMDSHSTERITRRIVYPNGEDIYADIMSVPILDSEHKLQSIIEIFIDKTEELELKNSLEKTYMLLVDSISKVLAKKDRYTAFHSANVKHYSLYLARYFNLNEADQKKIFIAASLHDIGKIAIPKSILSKPSALTGEEFNILKKHPIIGANLLSKITYFKDIVEIVEYHHEKVDGTGYPYGLKGSEIPFMAQIVCVADAFDALTTNRIYRKAMSVEYAVDEIKKASGTQFDKQIADAFVYLVENEIIKPIYM